MNQATWQEGWALLTEHFLKEPLPKDSRKPDIYLAALRDLGDEEFMRGVAGCIAQVRTYGDRLPFPVDIRERARPQPDREALGKLFGEIEHYVLFGRGPCDPATMIEKFGPVAAGVFRALGRGDFSHVNGEARPFALRRFADLYLEAWQTASDEALLGPPPDPKLPPGRVRDLMGETAKRIGRGA